MLQMLQRSRTALILTRPRGYPLLQRSIVGKASGKEVEHGHPSNHPAAPQLPPLFTPLRGKQLMEEPILNKGSAFTFEERETFHLRHHLPFEYHDLSIQVKRASDQLFSRSDPVLQYSFLRSLRDQNQVLFYALLQKSLKETLPIIYTPCVGEAIKRFSHLFRRPDGLFLSYPPFKEGGDAYIRDAMTNSGAYTRKDIDLIVVTDGEGILGIGDWGVGGINISIGKQALYTLGGGVDPNRCLNVVLDAGTNNQKLLDDHLYLGWRNKRIEGEYAVM
jgi:malate dehydrogenase (oxaloacetate-decarboxylating)